MEGLFYAAVVTQAVSNRDNRPSKVAYSSVSTTSTRLNKIAFRRLSATTIALWVVLGLLMVDSLLELAFVSSMVYFLHTRAGRDYQIFYTAGRGLSTFELSGRPQHLLLNQGHTSNGAAGTAFVLVGLGGTLVFSMMSFYKRKMGQVPQYVMILHHLWLVSTLLSVLLTLAALIYTFVVTKQTDDQYISISYAASLPNSHPYGRNTWTPETWFAAVLRLPLASADDRSSIKTRLRVMRGWRWNLIPMFLLGVALVGLAVMEALERRRVMCHDRESGMGEKRINGSQSE